MASSPDESSFLRLALAKALTPLLPILLIAAYFSAHIVYNLLISPLRHISGPKLWAVSNIPNAMMHSSGDAHKRTLELHQKYGDVVRVSPNKVSFLTSDAWRGLMGYQKDRGAENLKEPVYYEPMAKGILGASTEVHRRHRRVLAPAFSAQSMLEQEPLVRKYIDLLVAKLKERSQGGIVPLNVVEWYNWTTFDIIGDLAFGEPFGCLSNASYHPWVEMIFAVMKQATIITQIRYVWPNVQFWLRIFAGKAIDETIRAHQGLVKEKVAQSKELGTSRPGFMKAMLKSGAAENDKLDQDEIENNAGLLIVAGSETTATTLSGTTFLLCQHPEVLRRLTEEVRSTFKSEEEITFGSVHKLTYMLAVLRETMRIFPPAPGELPRIIPPAGGIICGKFLPGGTIVSMSQWALYHDPKNFAKPDEFHPDRWLDNPLFLNDNKDAFHPFSIGPRDCIGQSLALLEMRSVLTRIVWNFDLKLEEAQGEWMNQTKVYSIFEKGPLLVYMTPRTDITHTTKAPV